MMRRRLLLILMLLTLVSGALPLPGSGARAAAPYTIAYTLAITGTDQADVQIQVSGAPGATTELNADWMGDIFRAVGAVTVTDTGGKALPFTWTGSNQRTLRVQNAGSTEFTIRYPYDASKTIGTQYQQVVFEPRTVLFIADNVFLMPSAEPARITVKVNPPDGTQVFASLPEENGEFVAVKDLWGDLRYDFGKTYFSGGVPLFVLDHRTEWGDLYRYIWFDRDVSGMMWLSSYGDAPWEEAEAYMAMTERLAKYEREHLMGPLRPHIMLFTNARQTADHKHIVMSNTDFYQYMQIWPRDSEGEVAHHLLHGYTFHFRDQSKMSLLTTGFRWFLMEGLPTYVELTTPAIVEKDDHITGRLFEFWAIDQRGRPFGIQQNRDFHVKYNQSTMRVYLLDRYIQRVTDGKKDITDFSRAMWNVVKDRKAPAEFTEADALAAFASVVGTANQGYLQQLNDLADFAAADFTPLLPDFQKYVRWMADQYFGGNDLLFLAYLDIAAAKGSEWPHYATFPHNVKDYRRDGMTPFWQYLQGRSGTLTQADLLAALHAATGRDHAGFFEFWAAQGFTLEPNSLRSVKDWDPQAPAEADRMPMAWDTVGTLQVEYPLSGVLQPAMAVLDSPAPASSIVIEVTVAKPGGVPEMAEVQSALSGENVKLLTTYTLDWRGCPYAKADYQVTTTDPERRRFSFNLTMPAATSYPSFQVLRPEQVPDRGLGQLYFLPPATPLDFSLAFDAASRKLTLPAVSLTGAQFLITDGSDSIKAKPGETVQLKGDAPQIDLLDSYGFLRGRQSLSAAPPVQPPTQPPVQPPAQGDIQVTVDGQPVPFDVSPVNVNGRILVPLRAIAEALGAKVDWDPAAQVIAMTKNEHVVRLRIGGGQAALDGQYFTLDVPPQIIDGRTLVPVRFISQALGAAVNWDAGSRTVIITSP